MTLPQTELTKRKYYYKQVNLTEKTILIILASAWGAGTALTLSKIWAVFKEVTPIKRSYFTVRHTVRQLVIQERITVERDAIVTLPTGGGDNRRLYKLSNTTLTRLSKKAAELEFAQPTAHLKDY